MLKGQPRFDFLKKAIFVVLLALAAGTSAPVQEPPKKAASHPSESWYVIRIGQSEVGYLYEKIGPDFPGEEERPSARLRTESEMRLVLNRMGTLIELSVASSTEEDDQGRLLAARSEMKLSNQVTIIEAKVNPDSVDLRSEAAGQSYRRSIPYSGLLYGPEGSRKMTFAGLKKSGDKISFQTFILEASLVARVSRTLNAEEILETSRGQVKASRIEETVEGIPIRRTLWLDENGTLLKQTEPGPFGTIELRLSDRRTAHAAVAKAEWPMDMLEKSIIRSNIRLPRAKPIERLKVRLTHREPGLGWPELNRHHQRVLEKKETTLVLEIQRPPQPARASFPVPRTEETRGHLEANAYLQADDPAIEGLARQLVAGETDVFRAALAIEQWVAENLTFDLGLLLAPATEVFRDRRGTCLGYATLLAALCRAAGIPARVVFGYAYALGMFGGHAWVEFLAGDEWLPLDAALTNEGLADATRIAILSSSLADGPAELALSGAHLVFGQVDISILEYEVDGKTWKVEEGAKNYTVEGNSYDNPWLGIKLKKPDDFEFVQLEAVWPERTLIRLKGPAGESVSLEQHEAYPWTDGNEEARKKLERLIPDGQSLGLFLAGKKRALGRVERNHSTAALALARGLEIWVLKVEAGDALKLLRELAPRLHIED